MTEQQEGRSFAGLQNALNREAECRTNQDNVRYLLILAAILAGCDLLNEIGVFQVVPDVMRLGAACGTLCYLLPVVVLFRPLRVFRKNALDAVSHKWYKYFILTCTWLGTLAACITLTHHTVLSMAMPILIMSQYRNTKELVPLTTAFAVICVFMGVYGGYFWGCFDSNLLHIEITEQNAFDLGLRLELATMERMMELLTHYVLPRILIMLALIVLATKISRRNSEMLVRQAGLQSAVEREMQRTNEIQWQIIDGMANLIENRDASTGEHVKRTSFYVKSIVDELRADSPYQNALTDKKAANIVKAAPLHDIGKIIVADRILQKPGKLTSEEYEEIKLHASEGAKVIVNVLGNVEDDDFLHTAGEIAGGHHERWDGKGYPEGLAGTDIPLAARIMAVADVFDALVSERVYKQPVPPETAFAIIEEEAGRQFDPEVVLAFCRLKKQILSYFADSKACEEKKQPNAAV